MFGLGLPEIIVIFVIALVVFGPKKLPELGKSIGRAMAEFKKASEEFQESVRSEMKEAEKAADVKEEIKQIEQIAHTDVLAGTSPETGPAIEHPAYSEAATGEQETPAPVTENKEKKEHDEGNA